MSDLPSGTVTFLLTDVEGSTRSWETLPDVMGRAVARHYEILDDVVARHGGQRPQEQGEGDSIVAVFTDATVALDAAVAAQRALTAEPWPGGMQLRVRMALHSGQAQLRGEHNYDGPTIIRCARLRACGWGGQILLSDATAALVRDRPSAGIELASLGVHRLKDLDAAEGIHQVVADGLASAFPPLRSLSAKRHNLPSSHTSLIGRDDDLAALVELVTHERVVTLTGAGGVGKTRLAWRVAGECVDRFDAGAWWVDLAAVTDAESVPAAVLGAIGGAQQPFATVLDQLLTVLAPERMLVVLDNCEHLIAACSTLVDAVVHGCPGVTVLSTSREPLGVAGEVSWRVASLAVPADDVDLAPGDEARFAALTLFWDRARRARPQLAASPELLAASARICRRLDGIPLAIELAAARCRQFSPERIARDLDEHYRLVVGGAGQLPRQRTLEASVAWSHRLLDDDEQILFRRVAAFTSWFPLEAAEGVASALGGIDSWSVLDLVGRLVDKSLLTLDEDIDRPDPRYRMLETVRFFGLQRAQAAGELEQLRDAHARWWTDWITRVPTGFWPSLELLAGIDDYYPNLRSALDWVRARPHDAAALVQRLAWWLHIRGFNQDMATLCIPVAQDLRRAGDPAWAPTMAALASPALLIGDLDFVVDATPRARDAAVADGDWLTAGGCLATLALLDPTLQSWALVSEHGQRAGSHELVTLARLAVGANVTGDLPSSLADYRIVLEQARTRFPIMFELMLGGLTNYLLAMGRYDEAREVFAVQMSTSDRQSATGLLWHAATGAICALHHGDATELPVVLAHADSRRARGVSPVVAGMFRQPIAVAAHRLIGAPLDVDALVALAHTPMFGTPYREGYHLVALELLDRGLLDPARAILDQLAASPLADTPLQRLYCGSLRARLATANDDEATAHREWRAVLALAVAQDARPLAIDAVEAIAVMASPTQPVQAARLLGAAAAERDRTGYRLRFTGDRHRVDAARAVLDRHPDERASTAFDAGRDTSLGDVASQVERMRGPRGRPSIGWASLTPTERQVASLVTRGTSNAAIGRTLAMSVNTVKSHLSHIFRKLDISSRTELAALAARHADAEHEAAP